jgi:hypothetical protein
MLLGNFALDRLSGDHGQSMPTIYRTLLAKGYFPKELPPSFFSSHFAVFGTSKLGRQALLSFKPASEQTDCAPFDLALAGGGRRALTIPHPASYAQLAHAVAKNFRRLLTKAGRSKCARSKPVYSATGDRALRSSVKPANLSRERAIVRGGARYLVKADINQFYPSLYTHAIGWAIDPALRTPPFQKRKELGFHIDKQVRALQGKESHGIPIGNDISFLLAEVVLGAVDGALKLKKETATRWFDDYEIACASFEEAERTLSELQARLATFRLHLNPWKTRIIELPDPTLDTWQGELLAAARNLPDKPNATQMLLFFDHAFTLRRANPEPRSPILRVALIVGSK